jgi:shikimate kinase
MKFVMLYGPPASGKLTVAKELQKLSGFRLLHNHLIIDVLDSIASERDEIYNSIHEEILRLAVVFAVEKNVDVVNTFVYGKDEDDEHMRFIKKIVEDNGGQVFFIQLIADDEALYQRVGNESRKCFYKICDVNLLKELMSKYDLKTPYEETDLIINNTDKSPEEVASEIWKLVND